MPARRLLRRRELMLPAPSPFLFIACMSLLLWGLLYRLAALLF